MFLIKRKNKFNIYKIDLSYKILNYSKICLPEILILDIILLIYLIKLLIFYFLSLINF